MTTKLLAALFSWFLTLIGLAGPAETIGQNFSINAGDDLQSCDDIQVRSDEYEIARGDESFSIPLNRAVKVTPGSSNGPITLRDADGTFVLDAVNGPITIGGSRGTIDAETQNGPISVK